MQSSFIRLILGGSALLFFLIAVLFLAAPESTAASIGIKTLDDTGRTDIRATYGGMVLGIALFFAWASLQRARFRAGLWSILLIYGGLAGGRLLSLFPGAKLGGMMWTFLAIELAVAIASAALLRGLPADDASPG